MKYIKNPWFLKQQKQERRKEQIYNATMLIAMLWIVLIGVIALYV